MKNTARILMACLLILGMALTLAPVLVAQTVTATLTRFVRLKRFGELVQESRNAVAKLVRCSGPPWPARDLLFATTDELVAVVREKCMHHVYLEDTPRWHLDLPAAAPRRESDPFHWRLREGAESSLCQAATRADSSPLPPTHA